MKTQKNELIKNIQHFYFSVKEAAPTKEYLNNLNLSDLTEEHAKACLIYNKKIRDL